MVRTRATTMKTSLITPEINKRLLEAGVKPRKSLGQNFLVNKGIYEKIVSALEISPKDMVLEIGPGIGILTDDLIKTGAQVVAIEKDTALFEYLNKKYLSERRVKIIHKDVLDFDRKKCNLIVGRYKLVGNIPYYLTSHLFRTIFEEWPRPKAIIFMVQKEVAQRIVAKPPKMGLLGVSVQFFCSPEIISYVSKGSFYPAPKVDSAILKLSPRSPLEKIDIENFFQLVRAGFSGKRKQLINNLTRGLRLSKNEIGAKFRSADINDHRRSETLTVEEWLRLYKNFYFR